MKLPIPAWPRLRLSPSSAIYHLACIALFALSSTLLVAQNQVRRHFDVPAGEAIETLKTAARQAELEIMFPAETVRGVKTKAVEGDYTVMEALNRMLADTELYVVRDEQSGALSVLRQSRAPQQPPRTETSTSGKADGPIQLSAFEVTDRRTHGYQATSSNSATRLNTPIVELSKSIQVITRDLIDDLKVTELNDAVYLSSAVSETSPYSGRLAVRGFENAAAKRNGLGNYGSDETITDTATIERIEVVKGPSSLLYGSSSPGGVVNYVTKQPISYAQNSVRLVAGSFGKHRAEIDSGGPLIGDGKTLNYRLVGAYNEEDSFGKYNGGQRSVVAGSLRWHITPDTYILVGAQFDRGDRTNIRPGNYPISRSKFDANGNFVSLHDHFELSKEARDEWVGAFSGPYNRHHSRVQRYDADVFHKFTSELSLFAHYSYIDNNLQEAYSTSSAEGWQQSPYAVAGRNEMLQGGYWRTPHRRSGNGTVTLNYDLKRENFETQIIAGWEGYIFDLKQGDYSQDAKYWQLVNFVNQTGYGQTWENTLAGLNEGIANGHWHITDIYNRTQTYQAPYLLLHTYLMDRRLRIIAGIRHDAVTIKQIFHTKDATSSDPFALTAGSVSSNKASATTPMLGVSYSPIKDQKGFVVFGNYSESLVANEITNPDGSNLPPEIGKGWEIGTKLDLNQRLSMTLSYYTSDRTNLARGVPNTSPQQWVASGLQRSKGFDLDLFYAITPAWQLIASATTIDAVYIDDGDAALIGTRLPSVSKWNWSAWTKYNFTVGKLKGLSLGGGLVSRAQYQVYGANYPGMIGPEFTRVDLLANYTTKLNGHDLELSVKFNNIFDKVYLVGPVFGQPRSIETSVTMKF
ncbi:TonB-dependent receptor [Horticoccus luteus]|uniref:TonB-dependent receptor n=1 Tax=Horticoccus luteus TaxID=2862869 RepID=A0A8F9TZ67_9BACT|nr:TonB-dependent receptor [Horticoccus luteus]QYM80448.1 TonB-dependent receptor [Horticoccus luteus]